MLDFVLNFLYPPCCIICGKLDKNYICKNCEKRFERYRKYNEIDNKKILENKLNNAIKENYYDIDLQRFYWDKFLYVFEYKGIVRKTLLDYKFNGKPYLSNFFAYEILKSKKVYEILKFCDIIVPVPMDRKKRGLRGYNQTELISKILSKKSGIKEEKILQKTKQTKTQSLLKPEERKQNIENAFCIKNTELVKDRNIILLDDIYTTGATVNEISKILKDAGAKSVFVLVIAKD